MSLKLNSSGGGSVTLQEPSTASNVTLDLPATSGTVQVSGAGISGTTGTFTGLLDISAATAGQIQFPATQNASANANTLDDYEEGTFTPTLLGSGSNPSGTAGGNNAGNYTKIGRVVYFRANMSFGSIAGGSGAFLMGGLPFVAAFYWTGVTLAYRDAQSTTIPNAAMILSGTQQLQFWKSGSTSALTNVTAAYNVSDVGSSVDFYIAGFYFV